MDYPHPVNVIEDHWDHTMPGSFTDLDTCVIEAFGPMEGHCRINDNVFPSTSQRLADALSRNGQDIQIDWDPVRCVVTCVNNYVTFWKLNVYFWVFVDNTLENGSLKMKALSILLDLVFFSYFITSVLRAIVSTALSRHPDYCTISGKNIKFGLFLVCRYYGKWDINNGIKKNARSSSINKSFTENKK